jgi:hypothetical protein
MTTDTNGDFATKQLLVDGRLGLVRQAFQPDLVSPLSWKRGKQVRPESLTYKKLGCPIQKNIPRRRCQGRVPAIPIRIIPDVRRGWSRNLSTLKSEEPGMDANRHE